jgi:multidrug efflux system membrane fusion protein
MARTTLGRLGMRLLGPAIIVLAVLLGLRALQHLSTRPRTDDAIVTANTIEIVPEVTGRIASLNVRDDQEVHKGEVLFTVDPERYELLLAQTKAQVTSLEHQIALGNRTVASQRTGASVAKASVEAARARLATAAATVERLQPLFAKGYVTAEQMDVANTAKQNAEMHLKESTLATQQATQLVGDTDALRAQLEGARVLVAMAERDLRNTTVRAPFDGRVVGVKTSVGQLTSLVRPLFTLIDTSHWYVVANFRESELANMHPGQASTVYVMADPRRPIAGTVESLGSAVATLEDLTIAGVPHVLAKLNWVRIAQRFPVRVALTNPPSELMRVGASAIAIIHHERP